MTQENRERLYKDMRYSEKNYEARDGLNSGPTATATVRKRAKATADALLKQHPELEAPKPAPIIEEEKEEKPIKPTKSKGKK